MPNKKILVYVPPERMTWIKPILIGVPDIELCFDKDQIGQSMCQSKIVIDILQANLQASIEEIIEYHVIFDRVILIDCETPGNLKSLMQYIDLSKVCFLTTSRINLPAKYMTVIGHQTFFGVIQRLYRDDNYDSLDLAPYSIKPYFFDALLGSYKLSREYVYKSTLDRGLNHRHIYVKYFRQQRRALDEIIHEDSFDWPDNAQVIPETNADSWTTSDMVMFKGKSIPSSHIVPEKIYRDCAYSIVTESCIGADHVLFTEKTAKCLLARRLFVMFAGPGYIRHLQHLGFRTFGHIIDESYDLETDDQRRWSQAFDQVEKLISLPQEQVLDQCRDNIEHNFELFISRDWESEFHDNIKRLLIV